MYTPIRDHNFFNLLCNYNSYKAFFLNYSGQKSLPETQVCNFGEMFETNTQVRNYETQVRNLGDEFETIIHKFATMRCKFVTYET